MIPMAKKRTRDSLLIPEMMLIPQKEAPNIQKIQYVLFFGIIIIHVCRLSII
jgi:hypothetical protein